jgi:integral membrane protein
MSGPRAGPPDRLRAAASPRPPCPVPPVSDPSHRFRPLAPAGRVFAIVAFFEAFTWAGLLAGMVLKYGTGTTELGVWLFGRLHGAAFLAYVAVAVVVGVRLRWPLWALLLALLAAIPPLATLPLEIWYRRRGLLSAP